MKALTLATLMILASCGKISVDAPESIAVDIPNTNHTVGIDLESTKQYCQELVNHEIEKCLRSQQDYCVDMINDYEYLVDECYFEFDAQGMLDVLVKIADEI